MLEILSFLSLTVLVGFKLGPVFAEASIVDEICTKWHAIAKTCDCTPFLLAVYDKLSRYYCESQSHVF